MMNSIKNAQHLNQFPRMFDSIWLKDIDSKFSASANVPLTNLSETEEVYKIELVAPGLSKQAFAITLENNQLTISYTKPEIDEEGIKAKYYLKEFSVTNFSKSYKLPINKILEEGVEASYEAGILSIMLPKREEAKPKLPVKISVN